VIVVIGAVAYRPGPAGAGLAVGLAAGVAAAAAAEGSAVEILARIGEDGAGEELLLALARSRVGHLAVLRDPARPTPFAAPDAASADEADDLAPGLLAADTSTERPAGRSAGEPPAGGPAFATLEPADLSLGLRYLREYDVVVAVEPLPADSGTVVADAAAFAGAALVVVTREGTPASSAYPEATLFGAPTEDPEGAFARVVGRYAAALDRGVVPAAAFRAATETDGWQPAQG
jgi:hypothetical protein